MRYLVCTATDCARANRWQPLAVGFETTPPTPRPEAHTWQPNLMTQSIMSSTIKEPSEKALRCRRMIRLCRISGEDGVQRFVSLHREHIHARFCSLSNQNEFCIRKALLLGECLDMEVAVLLEPVAVESGHVLSASETPPAPRGMPSKVPESNGTAVVCSQLIG